MNYENGFKLLPLLEDLENKDLLKSVGWEINHAALLPIEYNTLLAYSTVLNWMSEGHWLVNKINHRAVYEGTSIYRIGDDLTFYVTLKNRVDTLNAQYKAVLLKTLINDGEILKEDIPSSILQVL